jgi:hypothetical protein
MKPKLVVVIGVLFALLAAVESRGSESWGGRPSDLISDGQFVYGPNVTAFDVDEYLSETHSPLTPRAGEISEACAYASVNPRLALALLEWRYGVVQKPTDTELEIKSFITNLAQQFYADLYARGSRSQPSGVRNLGSTRVSLADGTLVTLPPGASSGTWAVLRTLAPLCTGSDWDRLTDPNAWLLATYRRLFPGDEDRKSVV